MDPINYSIDVKSPFESAIQGYQLGTAIQSQQAAQQQKQLQIQQAQQMQADLGALSQKTNPTPQDFAQITTRYPQLAEHFKNTWNMLNQDQQQSQLSSASQVYAAINAGKPEIARQLLDTQAAAYRNSGDEKNAHVNETMSKLIEGSPETAKTSTGLFLSSILGPDKFASTFGALGAEQRATEKAPYELGKTKAEATQKTYEANNTPERLALENIYKGAEIRNLDSQIGERSGRLGLDRDKLQTETELKLYELNQKSNPALNLEGDAKKIINDSTVSSVAAEQSASQINDLANRLEKEGGGYGAFGSASEWVKKTTGNQDSMTQMRNEYTRIRNSQAVKLLPPGSASDKDVSMAMGGFPPETADAKTMASFLRGMAKLNQYTAVSDNAKAEWVNAVGHLGKPKTDINIDGVSVPAGSTFTDFARQYMASKVDQRQTQAAQQQLQGRSYMRFAQPQGVQ